MAEAPSPDQARAAGVVEFVIFGGAAYYRQVARCSDDGAQVRACLLLAADEIDALQAQAPPATATRSQ